MKLLALVFYCFLTISVTFGQRGGRSDSYGNGGRIVGGEDIQIFEAPYQVSLMYYGYHMCGGAIISKDYIITACHCKLKVLVVKSLSGILFHVRHLR
jgi:secreted trypsin-like serine protease